MIDLNRWAANPWLKWRAIGAGAILLLVIVVAIAVAAAISPDRPSEALVDRIEALALHDPCVAPLRQWWRQYAFKRSYGPNGIAVDRSVVQVSLIEAGHDGHPAGRFILSNPEPPGIDDSQFRLANGEYDIARRRFTRWTCGSNWPPGNGPR